MNLSPWDQEMCPSSALKRHLLSKCIFCCWGGSLFQLPSVLIIMPKHLRVLKSEAHVPFFYCPHTNKTPLCTRYCWQVFWRSQSYLVICRPVSWHICIKYIYGWLERQNETTKGYNIHDTIHFAGSIYYFSQGLLHSEFLQFHLFFLFTIGQIILLDFLGVFSFLLQEEHGWSWESNH